MTLEFNPAKPGKPDTRLQTLTTELEQLEANIAATAERMLRLEPQAVFHSGIRIEFRFGRRDYALIADLKREPFVDRELTLMSKAGISAVVGAG